jgi:hypothetical protein
MADNADYADCKFVVLDYCDPGPVRRYLWDNYRDDMRSGRLVVYSYLYNAPDPVSVLSNRVPPPDVSFHMAHAKNLAARCGIMEGADVLVTLDADNLTGPGFARYVADTWSDGTFLCPNFPLINSMPHGPGRPPRGYAGRLALRAHDFIKAGGYDEIYDTWRGEDMDMLYRLQRMGYRKRHIDNRFLNAVRHNAEVRFKEYPHAQQYETDNYMKVIAARTETVVNFGKIGMGTVYRNFNPERIGVRALPARVFGIGLHRTATTSLHAAFELLGFDSFHFRTGNEARLIWDEMNSSGSSVELEKWYALCDLPVPLLYQKLDCAYPGSKFVLTVRDEQSWLRSVERLWDPEHNPERWTWDVYPFSHRIHKALYGSQEFNAEVFLARYRRHNTEVREYFRNRPDDLLVMEMDAGGATWPDLCRLVGASVPSVPYPYKSHMNKAD